MRKRRNESGMAIIETLPILVIFLVLISYAIGYFGVVHTAILNSISARAYAFETFRNRNNLVVFRDNMDKISDNSQFKDFGNRLHAITSEKNMDGSLGDATFATSRPIAFGRNPAASEAGELDHNVNIYNIAGRNRKGGVEASPAWVMVGYGICINAQCGD